MGELDEQTNDYIAIRRLQDAYADVVSRARSTSSTICSCLPRR